MTSTKLDQIVKGAPPPSISLPAVASSVAANPPSASLAAAVRESHRPVAPRSASTTINSDATLAAPNTPLQIYLNLLILEASLRAQYIALCARRRQHTFFLILLATWITYFTYAEFFRPREDGKGHGGSVYWVQDMCEKVSFLGGVITAVLVWATGIWERGLRWPRRWVGITNRGLRTVNLKIVVLKGPWWRQLLSSASVLLPHKSFFFSTNSSYRFVSADLEKRVDESASAKEPRRASLTTRRGSQGMVEEDVGRGGDHIKLLLLPKHFSADFRQNWEIYRNEYWEAENNRRTELRKVLRKQQMDKAKLEGGWLWWARYKSLRVALGRGGAAVLGSDAEKSHHAHHHTHRKESISSTKKTRPKDLLESHSRSSSRSSHTSTGTPEPIGERGRRSSLRRSTGSTSNSSTARRPRRSTSELDDGEALGVRKEQERTRETSDESDSTATRGSESGSNAPRRSSRETTAGTSEDTAAEEPKESVASRTRQRDLVMIDEDSG